MLLLVTFAGLFGTSAVEVAGQEVPANRASVPGIMGLAVLTASFMALAIAVVSQRETGILKRRRATPVPAAVLVVSRALTATISSVAACWCSSPSPGWGSASTRRPAACCPRCSRSWSARSASLRAPTRSRPASRNAESAQPLMQALMLPLQMISGIYFPMSQLPDWLQHVANAFPLAHLTNALQHAWLPSGAQIAWGDLGIMALWAVGAAFVAARRFQWLPRN